MQVLFGVFCTLIGLFELVNVALSSPQSPANDRGWVMAVCGVLMVAGLQIVASAGRRATPPERTEPFPGK